jgi:hypothetical protein
MLFHRTSFIGIDPTAGTRPFVYAALDHELKLLALSEGDMEEVMAFVAGQQEAFVAVNAPRQPNQGLMADPQLRRSLSPPPHAGRWTDSRVVEYQLWQHNIKVMPTPSKEEACPGWMQMGFQVYARLTRLGYSLYPMGEQQLQMMEVYPHASYCAWLDRVPLKKATLEGRLQRQLVLYELDLDVPDPIRFFFEEITRHRLLRGVLPLDRLYTPAELDALAGAYTAWMAANQNEEITLFGDPAEGQIVLPIATLAEEYS